MKANVPFGKNKMIVARWLAIRLEEGKLTSLKTTEARNFIKEHYVQFVAFPGEEV